MAGSLLLFFASHLEGVGTSTREVEVLVLKSFSSMLPCTCPYDSLVEKTLVTIQCTKESRIDQRVGTEGRSQHAISVFNACSEMTTCHYNVVLYVWTGCGTLHLMDRLLDLSLKTEVADIETFNTVFKGHARFVSVENTWNVVDTL